jgi:hypothetical protein
MIKFNAKEKTHLNQFWYSVSTIEKMISEVQRVKPNRTAFLSTPSLFAYAVEAGIPCDLFDIDPEVCANVVNQSSQYIKYDFRISEIAAERRGLYGMVIIDPPFISSDVLEAYSQTANQLLMHEGKVVISTVQENYEILRDMYPNIHPVKFQPSIPRLVYQYSLFTNYELAKDSPLNEPNDELHNQTAIESF